MQQLWWQEPKCERIISYLFGSGQHEEATERLEQKLVVFNPYTDIEENWELGSGNWTLSCRQFNSSSDFSSGVYLDFGDFSQIADISPLATSFVTWTTLQQLKLSFQSCSKLADISPLASSFGSLTSLQELHLDFSNCSQLSDISPLATSFATLSNLQQIFLDFWRCSNLADVSPLAGSFGTLTALKQMHLNFNDCS